MSREFDIDEQLDDELVADMISEGGPMAEDAFGGGDVGAELKDSDSVVVDVEGDVTDMISEGGPVEDSDPVDDLEETQEWSGVSDDDQSSAAEMVSVGAAGEEEYQIFVEEEAAVSSADAALASVKLPKRIVGPLAVLALLVACGWFVVGGVVLAFMSGTAAWIIGGVSLVAGLVTATIGLTMTVKVSEQGVKLPFKPLIEWDQIVGVRLVSMIGWGRMSTPMLEVVDGRAIKELELEGLASTGKGNGAQKRAELLSVAGNVPVLTEDEQESDDITPRRAV